MQMTSLTRKSALAAVLSITAAGLAFGGDGAFTANRITIASDKSFDEVTKSVKTLVAKNGMMVMAEVNQGKMLSMTGLDLKATLFVVGNPQVGKQLFEQDRAVGLYVPLRVFVYNDKSGKTFVSYDKPSSILGQFDDQKISMVAQMLDEKLGGLANMAAH
jgi:uncharacterized protein (DUF302 family)